LALEERMSLAMHAVLGYSAEPDTEDAEKLELLAVIGTQSLAAE
jgi:hypothetical protein